MYSYVPVALDMDGWELDLGPGSDLEDEMSKKSEGEEYFE